MSWKPNEILSPPYKISTDKLETRQYRFSGRGGKVALCVAIQWRFMGGRGLYLMYVFLF